MNNKIFEAIEIRIAQELPTYEDHNVAARDSNEVADTLNRRCYPYTRNGGHSLTLL